jgi:hypothetical protein
MSRLAAAVLLIGGAVGAFVYLERHARPVEDPAIPDVKTVRSPARRARAKRSGSAPKTPQDRQEYNDYMREYMRKRRAAAKALAP